MQKKSQKMAWPSVGVCGGELNCALDSFDCLHAFLRLAVFIRFYFVPLFITILMRSTFFRSLLTRYQVNTSKASPGDNFTIFASFAITYERFYDLTRRMPKNARIIPPQPVTTSVETHPRGERAVPLLESLEEELGLPMLFQEAKEEDRPPLLPGRSDNSPSTPTWRVCSPNQIQKPLTSSLMSMSTTFSATCSATETSR